MSLRRTLILICATAGAACLVLGYVSAGRGMLALVALVTLPAWWLTYKRPGAFPPVAALVISVGLAAGGLLAGATPWLMLVSATLALAGWDLVLLEHSLPGSSSAATSTLTQFMSLHYTSLALPLGLGLLIAVVVRMIPVQVPFWGMVLLAIFALWSFDRAWRMVGRV